ncbi:response regulator transcription factor [Pedobacter sp. MC2016-24]|uniref:response regulator transcription factor n=1 Tax=Pedobacter sp. MC2016-24 TaxID=2780090 RepID=UPI00187E1C17|nr:LuxR C-terminal-related transcriptional regulator [Pedobacter sp. MC2016-24]MBE9599513.1 response regulator transcription factor [Pedobacter sp. MC2016-24]
MMNIENTDQIKEEQKLFSKREVEILQLMAEGCTSKMIAEKLFISEHTVIAHRKNMQQKTGLSNAIALVYFAAKNDII